MSTNIRILSPSNFLSWSIIIISFFNIVYRRSNTFIILYIASNLPSGSIIIIPFFDNDSISSTDGQILSWSCIQLSSRSNHHHCFPSTVCQYTKNTGCDSDLPSRFPRRLNRVPEESNFNFLFVAQRGCEVAARGKIHGRRVRWLSYD